MLLLTPVTQDETSSTSPKAESDRESMHSSQTEALELFVIEIGRRAHLITSAEAELSAFMRAIDSSFGKEAAQLAGEYWVTELEIADVSFEALSPDWRRVTVSALLSLIKGGCMLTSKETGWDFSEHGA